MNPPRRPHGPDVVYIGAQKTGSTYLRGYFEQHPQIEWARQAIRFQDEVFDGAQYLSGFHEPRSTESRCVLDMYEGLAVGYRFEGHGEWNARAALNPSLSLHDSGMIPASRDVAARIKQTVPDARILVTLRNQVDWLISNYLHHISLLPGNRRGFQDFLATSEGKLLLAAGCYDQLLTTYSEFFGQDRVHVILLEDLYASEEKVLKGLCEFLGVEYRRFDNTNANRNTGIGGTRAALLKIYSRLGLGDWLIRWLRPGLKPVEQMISAAVRIPAISKKEESMIRAFYSVSNYNLSRRLGRDLGPLGYTD